MTLMKDINITYNEYLTTDNDDTDDYIFNKIIENYNIYHITNIFNLWHFTYCLDLDEDELETDNIISINDMNLSIINNTHQIFIVIMNMNIMNTHHIMRNIKIFNRMRGRSSITF